MARERVMANTVWHGFNSGPHLAEALADAVAGRLAAAIKARGTGLLAVSGGSTPPPFFRALSRRKLDWRRVIVTLVDERFVPPASERSNGRLAARHLLQNEAARAEFVPLYHEADSVEEAADKADRTIAALPLPLDIAVLGMGTDGHTASFFPDAEGLPALLAEERRHVLPVHAPSAREPRLTLSLPLLCGAGLIVLHIEGEEKKKAFEAAFAESAEAEAPIHTLVSRAATPVQIYWAPSAAKSDPAAPATP